MNILLHFFTAEIVSICIDYISHIDKYVFGLEPLNPSLTKKDKIALRYAIIKRHVVFDEIMLCTFLLNHNIICDGFDFLSTIVPYINIHNPMELRFCHGNKSITYYFLVNTDKPLFSKSFYLDSALLNIHFYNYEKLRFNIRHDICIHNPQKLIRTQPPRECIITSGCYNKRKHNHVDTKFSIN